MRSPSKTIRLQRPNVMRALAGWFAGQLGRRKTQANTLEEERLRRREKLQRGVAQVERFFRKHGHYHVPRVGPTAELGNWAHSMVLFEYRSPGHRDLRYLERVSMHFAQHLKFCASAPAVVLPILSKRARFEECADAWIQFVTRCRRLPHTDGVIESERVVARWELEFADMFAGHLQSERRALLGEIRVVRKGLEAGMHPETLLDPLMCERLDQLLTAAMTANPASVIRDTDIAAVDARASTY